MTNATIPVPPCPVPLPDAQPAPGAFLPPPSTAGPLLAPLLPPTPVLPAEQPLPAVDGRYADGKFAPGNAGRPVGARHRTTRAMEALMEGQWEGLTKTAIAQALRGDTTALRLCIDRLAPVRRGSVVSIPDFPKLETATDVPRAHAALLAAVTDGILSADEAAPISGLLANFASSIDSAVFAEKLAELEKRLDDGEVGLGSR